MSVATGLHTVSQRSKKAGVERRRGGGSVSLSHSHALPLSSFPQKKINKSIKNRRHATIMPSGCQLAYSPPAFSRTLQNNKDTAPHSPTPIFHCSLILPHHVRSYHSTHHSTSYAHAHQIPAIPHITLQTTSTHHLQHRAPARRPNHTHPAYLHSFHQLLPHPTTQHAPASLTPLLAALSPGASNAPPEPPHHSSTTSTPPHHHMSPT